MPRPPEGSKRAARKDLPKLTRAEAMGKGRSAAAMPPNPAPHIIARLIEIGLSEAAGMGVVPLSWGEIVAWQMATGVKLEPWESRLIRRLSAAYIAEGRRAESENAPAPWRTEIGEAERREEEAGLRSLVRRA